MVLLLRTLAETPRDSRGKLHYGSGMRASRQDGTMYLCRVSVQTGSARVGSRMSRCNRNLLAWHRRMPEQDYGTQPRSVMHDQIGEVIQSIFAPLSWCVCGMLVMYWGQNIQQGVLFENSREDPEEPEPESVDDNVFEPGPSPGPVTSIQDVWKYAWRPIEDAALFEIASEACSTAENDCLRETPPFLWIQAIRKSEKQHLFSLCMSSLQRQVGMITVPGSMDSRWFVTLETVERMLSLAAVDASKEWLGYVPSLVSGNDGPEDKPKYRNKYQKMWIEEKASLYVSVVRLMSSQVVDGSSCGGCAREDEESILVGRENNFRSWRSNSPVSSGFSRKANYIEGDLLDISPLVLQDMTVAIADVICAGYMEDVVNGFPSITPSPNSESLDRCRTSPGISPSLLEVSLWPSFLNKSLNSTREIQTFANKLYYNRFIEDYFHSIVSIYEDRLNLFGIQAIDNTVAAIRTGIKVRRAHELSNLQGTKYLVSLAVEALDFIKPFIIAFRETLSKLFTWILKDAIGKSIGYIVQGMQQTPRDSKSKKMAKCNTKADDPDASGNLTPQYSITTQ